MISHIAGVVLLAVFVLFATVLCGKAANGWNNISWKQATIEGLQVLGIVLAVAGVLFLSIMLITQ